MKNKITLDILAQMIGNGFAENDKRFQEIDMRFEEIKEILEDHDDRFDMIDRKLNAVVEQQDRQGIEIKSIKTHLALG